MTGACKCETLGLYLYLPEIMFHVPFDLALMNFFPTSKDGKHPNWNCQKHQFGYKIKDNQQPIQHCSPKSQEEKIEGG